MAQHKGKVAWFNNAKGFAFLTRTGGSDGFVRYSAVYQDGCKSLKKGEDASFDIITSEHGPQIQGRADSTNDTNFAVGGIVRKSR